MTAYLLEYRIRRNGTWKIEEEYFRVKDEQKAYARRREIDPSKEPKVMLAEVDDGFDQWYRPKVRT